MAIVRINKQKVLELLQNLPDKGQVFYWDDKLIGFGVKATPSGLSYIVQDRVNGKTCRAIIGKHGPFTPDSAREQAKDKLNTMEQGKNLNDEKKKARAQAITLREVFEDFKNSHKLRPTTIKIYEGALKRSFADWQDRPITEITKEKIEKRHRKLSNIPEAKRKKAEWKGEAQANQAMRTLRTLLNYAACSYEDVDGRSILPENPVKRLSQNRSWNKIPMRQDVIADDDLKDWYAAVKELPTESLRDYLLLCLFTGLRRTEAATLKWSNVDLKKPETAYLRIDADMSKNGEEHHLPLSDVVYKLLKKRSKVRVLKNSYVFPGARDNLHLVESKWSVARVTELSVKARLQRQEEPIGVKFTMHTLRRTFATVAERLDISHYSLKKLLNHKSSSDVTSRYAVVSVEDLRPAMQKIADHLKHHTGLMLNDFVVEAECAS
jgi:integrase